MIFCPAPRKWFKGHAPAWLFFFFAQLFLFLNPDTLPDWRSLKKRKFPRACVCTRVSSNYILSFYFSFIFFIKRKVSETMPLNSELWERNGNNFRKNVLNFGRNSNNFGRNKD